jgi:hypothetical protein
MLAAWACGLALLWPVRRAGFVWVRVALSALALAVAELAGWWVLEGRPHLPPVEAMDWLVPVAFGAAVLAAVAHVVPGWERFVLVGGVCALVWSRIVIFPMPGYTLDGSVFWLVLLGLCTSGVWMALASTAHCTSPAHARVTVAISAGGLVLSIAGAGVALMLSGSLRLGQVAMVSAAVAASAALSGPMLWPGTALLVPTALLVASLISGCFYADLPVASAVFLGAAPATVRVSRGLWRVVLVLGLVALGVLLAWQHSPPFEG